MRKDIKLALIGIALFSVSYTAAVMTPHLGDPTLPWWTIVSIFSLFGGAVALVLATLIHFGEIN